MSHIDQGPEPRAERPDFARRSVRIHIDLAAIAANLALARQHSGGSRQFAVVKADAYGHGAVPVAQYLASAGGADGFAVVSLGEAVELREAGIQQPILVLQGPQRGADLEWFAELNLWPALHTEHQIEDFRASRYGTPLTAWLKVDSGMGRLGVNLQQATYWLQPERRIAWRGVLSHFACADEPGNTHTQAQIKAFNALPVPAHAWRSLANSAGTLAWPTARSDWARPGFMLYGGDAFAPGPGPDLGPGAADANRPQPAMRVEAPLISVRTLPAGAGIGYGQSWVTPETMTVGYVAAGYGDGLPRVLGEGARVLFRGRPCAVLGRVSMDSLVIDLRDTPGAMVGEPVLLWGAEHPVEHLAAAAGTIGYELLTNIRGVRRYG